ncbi:uncharacterized protein JN550_013692 [Neoarthrinium moseri]|uniref:uncharacterized protein n=1 Tax=Neoarthrinium moseri TaxID=1658444 RepID=UPI001FDAE5D4|nr:uncharacterized protein JN550_013692 [Neoarthrinium moseri]KAI1856698.1 hypothetical protein JN550_013692 [Neoarthrinium moseri]
MFITLSLSTTVSSSSNLSEHTHMMAFRGRTRTRRKRSLCPSPDTLSSYTSDEPDGTSDAGVAEPETVGSDGSAVLPEPHILDVWGRKALADDNDNDNGNNTKQNNMTSFRHVGQSLSSFRDDNNDEPSQNVVQIIAALSQIQEGIESLKIAISKAK